MAGQGRSLRARCTPVIRRALANPIHEPRKLISLGTIQGNSISFFQLIWIAPKGAIVFSRAILKCYRRRIAAKPLTSAGARCGGKCRRFVGLVFSFCRGINFDLSDSRWRCPRTPARRRFAPWTPTLRELFLNSVAQGRIIPPLDDWRSLVIQ